MWRVLLICCCCIAAVSTAADVAVKPSIEAPAALEAIPLSSSVLAMTSDTGLFSALLASFCIIVVSEIGDKTFFIAALLAMKRGALVTFSGAASALAIMTLLSALVGRALPAILDPKFTRLASILLFLFFGSKLLYEGYHMEKEDTEEVPAELVEVEQALAAADEKKEVDIEAARDITPSKPFADSNWIRLLKTIHSLPTLFISAAFIEAFTLTFAAEWGDRSQIATFALGASKNFVGVNIGAILGHLSCTAGAVIGGKVLASRISERLIALLGGATFLVFALLGAVY